MGTSINKTSKTKVGKVQTGKLIPVKQSAVKSKKLSESKALDGSQINILDSINSWSEIDSFIDKLIDFSNIEITAIDFHKKQDLMIVVLNNGKIIREAISKFPLLSKGTEKQLKQYSLYAGKTAIEWEELDEDISLRGLLKDQILHTIAA